MILTLPVLVFAFITCYFYYHFVHKRRHLPPGPAPLPLIGNTFQLDKTKPQKTLMKWAAKYGPIYTVWMGSQPNIFFTDYRLLKEYFVKQGYVFAGRPPNPMQALTGGAYGIVTVEGEFWKEQRRFALHVFRDFGFGRNLMEEKILKQVDILIGRIQKKAGETISLKHELELCVGNVINSLIFGYSYEKGDTEAQFMEFTKILNKNIKLIMRPEVMLLGMCPWLRYVPLFENFGHNLLERNEKAFMKLFVEQIENHKQNLDDITLMETDPSDYTAAFRKERLRRQNLGQDTGSFSETQLKMANRELYNMTSSKPDKRSTMSQHTVTRDTVVEGHVLRKGTVVVPQISVVLSDPKIWSNPDEFQPERFLEADGKTLKKAEELVPFSVGKRQCLGESLGRMELFLIFSTLIRHFKFAPKLGHGPPSLVGTVGFIHNPPEYEVFIENRT